MKQVLLNVLFGSILLGCSDRYTGDDSIDSVKSERTTVVRLADLSRSGINDMNGFVKRGNKLVVGTTLYFGRGWAFS